MWRSDGPMGWQYETKSSEAAAPFGLWGTELQRKESMLACEGAVLRVCGKRRLQPFSPCELSPVKVPEVA